MVNTLIQKLMMSRTCSANDLDKLVHELVLAANRMESGKPFHVRDLVEEIAVWRAWYLYWYIQNISVVLQLGKKFYKHPELNATFIGYDPTPKDGAAMYVNQ